MIVLLKSCQFLVMICVLALLFILKAGDLLCAVIGMFSMKIAAYMCPVLNRRKSTKGENSSDAIDQADKNIIEKESE